MNGAAVRRRLVPLLVVIGALLVPALKLGWHFAASRTADGISVAWEPSCPEMMDAESDVWLFDARPGWSCRILVTVTNDSAFGVRMVAIESPRAVGNVAGEVLAIPWSAADYPKAGNAAHLDPSSASDVQARWRTRVAIPAGESRTFAIVFGWRPAGCDLGQQLIVPGWPRITFDALWMTHHVGSDQELRIDTYDGGQGTSQCTGLRGS